MPKQVSSKAASSKLRSKPITTYSRAKTKRAKVSPSPEVIDNGSSMSKAGNSFFATALREKKENWDEKMRLELAQERRSHDSPSPSSKRTKVYMPLRSRKISNKEKTQAQPISSLEDFQTSSPPRPSSPVSYRTNRAQAGPGPISTRSIASRNSQTPTRSKKDRSSSALPDRFSMSPPPAPAPLGMTRPLKMTGLDAIKQTLRRPQSIPAPRSGIEFMDAERETLEVRLRRKETEREEKEIRSAGQKFFDEMKNRPKPAARPVPIVPPSPQALHEQEKKASDATLAMNDLMAAYQAEYEPEETVTEEEKGYLKRFCDPHRKCPICDMPLPLKPTDVFDQSLKSLKARIRAHGKDSIDTMEQIEFCLAHENATTTIPLGRRAGYPEKILWQDIWREIERPWIRKRMDLMVKNPLSSPMFRHYFSDATKDEDEDPEWATVYHRSTASDRMTAGYYGDLGRELIKTYLLELVDWGHLPLFEIQNRYKPLGAKPFLARVLIPEVATMLIQSRLGYSPTDNSDIEDESYTQAQKIRKKSMAYGRTAYGDMDSDLGSEIMLEWNRGVKNRRAEMEKMRASEGSGASGGRVKKRAKAAVIDLSDEVDEKADIDPKIVQTKQSSLSPLMVTTDTEEDEREDGDLETVKPSQTSYTSSTRLHSQETVIVPPTPSPPVNQRQSSLSSSIQEVQKRKRNPRGRSRSESQSQSLGRKRKRSSQPATPSESQQLSQSTSAVSITTSSIYPNRTERRKAKRGAEKIEKRKQAVEAVRLSVSQDSFDDMFDHISSQEYARLDAEVVAAQ